MNYQILENLTTLVVITQTQLLVHNLQLTHNMFFNS